MRKNIKLPTILGVLVLLFGLAAGIYLINSKQIFKLGAQASSAPKNVRITNIKDSSASVTWTTDVESQGFVKWGYSQSALSNVTLEEGSAKSYVHSVNLANLNNSSDIFIKINSDGKDYDNDGIPWETKTLAQAVNGEPQLIAAGTVLEPDSTTPAKALVYLTINGSLLSSLTSMEGSWVIPVSSYVTSVADSTALEISVNAGVKGTSRAVIYPKAVKATPTIILGKTYDFRTLEVNTNGNLPESSLSLPESIEISSRFEVSSKGVTPIPATVVTLDSVKDGEIINTTDPEFFGEAPKQTEIEITVESEMQTETIKASSKGTWSWSPPTNLEPGEHTVTIKWRDASGVLRTITRSFIVQAAEGPAFVATPSATPKNTTTGTATPTGTSRATSSATPRITSAATAPPTPATGDLTPTLGLFIMGIGIFLSSLYIWNKADA